MAGSHSVAIRGPRVHPSAQQRLEQVHLQRLCSAHPIVLQAFLSPVPSNSEVHIICHISRNTEGTGAAVLSGQALDQLCELSWERP